MNTHGFGGGVLAGSAGDHRWDVAAFTFGAFAASRGAAGAAASANDGKQGSGESATTSIVAHAALRDGLAWDHVAVYFSDKHGTLKTDEAGRPDVVSAIGHLARMIQPKLQEIGFGALRDQLFAETRDNLPDDFPLPLPGEGTGAGAGFGSGCHSSGAGQNRPPEAVDDDYNTPRFNQLTVNPQGVLAQGNRILSR